MMTRLVVLAISCSLAFAIPASGAEEGEEPSSKSAAKAERKRAKVDAMERQTLATLFEQSGRAKSMAERAFGHAVFDNRKVSLAIASGNGLGVAVEKGSGARTYMRMATAGLNLGMGVQLYQVIFLFEDERTFRRFVDKGWEAGSSASAAAGTEGKNAEIPFVNGMAVFQLTEKGLMLQADLTGTKYWKAKKLNAAAD